MPDHEVPWSVELDMWMLSLGGTVLSIYIDQQIQQGMHDPKLQQLWIEKGKTTKASDFAID